MTKKFIIYEPPICCPSGVCGPNPDQTLIALKDTIAEVKKLGADVECYLSYLITQSPEEFKKNSEVIKLIQERQLKALPITTFNGKIIKSGGYPRLRNLRNLSISN